MAAPESFIAPDPRTARYFATRACRDHPGRGVRLHEAQLELKGFQGVEHQHGDRHGTDTTGNGGDVAGDLLGGIEIHVALQDGHFLAGLLADLLTHAVDADVDHAGPRFDPFRFHQVGNTSGHDENVGPFAVGGQILGARMHDGHGSVGARAFLHHHVGDGFAHDVGATHDDHFGAAGLNAGAHDHLLDAERRARRKFDFLAPDHQTADVDRMEPVDILVRIDGVEHFFLINVLGQGQLNQDTVDAVVLVVLVDQGQKIRFGNIHRLAVLNFLESDAVGGFDLEGHIGNGCRVLAHEDGDQPGNHAVLFLDLFYLFGNLLEDLLADLGTLDKRCCHLLSPFTLMVAVRMLRST
ncbi:conserved hypothetical protein [Desulfosarcina cetonica]|nr:conserved hypothetical protein [Desulfosarcina cetonica]